jgi:hypothetical protein
MDDLREKLRDFQPKTQQKGTKTLAARHLQKSVFGGQLSVLVPHRSIINSYRIFEYKNAGAQSAPYTN